MTSVDGSSTTLAWAALGGLALAGLVIIGFGARLSESRDKVHVQARQLDQASPRSMRGLIRVGDRVGRWGGEEFLAILPDADAGAALLVAEPVSA